MINNKLLLTDTNSEFVRVRFEFVVIYFSIPAAPLAFTLSGCPFRSVPLAPVVWGAGRRFSIDAAGFGCEVGNDAWVGVTCGASKSRTK